MPSEIPVTNHFVERYRERVAKTKRERIKKFAKEAFENGKTGKDLKCRHYGKFVDEKYGSSAVIAKIYKGFVYIFSGDSNAAITVFRVPKKVHGLSTCVW